MIYVLRFNNYSCTKTTLSQVCHLSSSPPNCFRISCCKTITSQQRPGSERLNLLQVLPLVATLCWLVSRPSRILWRHIRIGWPKCSPGWSTSSGAWHSPGSVPLCPKMPGMPVERPEDKLRITLHNIWKDFGEVQNFPNVLEGDVLRMCKVSKVYPRSG